MIHSSISALDGAHLVPSFLGWFLFTPRYQFVFLRLNSASSWLGMVRVGWGESGGAEGGGGGSKSFRIPLLVDKCIGIELVLDLALLTFDQIPDCTPEGDSFVEEKLLTYEN